MYFFHLINLHFETNLAMSNCVCDAPSLESQENIATVSPVVRCLPECSVQTVLLARWICPSLSPFSYGKSLAGSLLNKPHILAKSVKLNLRLNRVYN